MAIAQSNIAAPGPNDDFRAEHTARIGESAPAAPARTAFADPSSPTPAREHGCHTPTVTLMAAGGCGINLTRLVLQNVTAQDVDHVIRVDTSVANVIGDEEVHIIANGFGGGKNQRRNLHEIEKNISHFDALPDTDVYIIVFGITGASGGVLGTLFAEHLLGKGKTVVPVIVADSSSEIDSENALRTLKSLKSISSNHYLPTILAENHGDASRHQVDAYLQGQIVGLINILKWPTMEVDRNDRLTWLNPSSAVSVDTSIHMLYVDSADVLIPEESGLGDVRRIHDSVLSLGVRDKNGEAEFITGIAEHSRFRKSGVFVGTPPHVHPLLGVITNVGFPIDAVIDGIEKAKSLFRSQSSKVESKLKVDSAELSGGRHAF